jgi:hypothetical protein
MVIGDGLANPAQFRLNNQNPATLQAGVYSGTHSTTNHQACAVYANTFTANRRRRILAEETPALASLKMLLPSDDIL